MRPIFWLRSLLLLLIVLNSAFAYAGFDSNPLPQVSKIDGSPSIPSTAQRAKGPKYRSDELLVKFKAGTSEQSSKSVHGRRGGALIKEFPRLRLHHVKLKAGASLDEALKQYRAEPDVEYAEPNFLYSVHGQPNDSYFPVQWALQNTGQNGGTPGADIKATAAWDLTTGSSDVVVAVIDSGIDTSHMDLTENIWQGGGLNVTNPFKAESPFDDNGHGTHIAGIIGAHGNNATGMAGINWDIKLIACKFIQWDGSGATSDAIHCLEHVKSLKDGGANIVATNNSWGSNEFSQALFDAIDAQRDILFVASAGNDWSDNDSTPVYPASYNLPNIISVAATTETDDLLYFSNYGSRSVHVGAPGSHIVSTMSPINGYGIGTAYGELTGSSFAAPHVTGLAALLKAQQPSRDWRQIRNLILIGGDKLPSLENDTMTGRRINAFGSVSCTDKAQLLPLQYPESFPFTAGTYTLSAWSINCGNPVGPVTVTTSVGDTVTLHDDGVFPDLAAGDGIFTASWTPPFYFVPKPVRYLKFSSPAGVVYIPSVTVSSYLPEGNLNHVYRQHIEAVGTPPYVWSLTSGALPDGLTLNSATGEVFGFPRSVGTSAFDVTVTDADGRSGSQHYSLKVVNDLIIEDLPMTYRHTKKAFPFAVAVDGGGNAYLTGGTEQGALDDYLTVKFGPSGGVMWDKTYDAGEEEWAKGVAIDSSGNVYVTGGVNDPTKVMGRNTNVPITTVKYDPQGNVLWTRTFSDGKLDTASGAVVDSAGNVYVAGYNVYGSPYQYDALLVKYDAAGNELWTRNYHAAQKNIIYAVALDGSDNVYLAGTSGTDTDQTYRSLTVKYSPDGTLLWDKIYNDGSAEPGTWQARAVAAGADGSAYVAGNVGPLIKYNAQGGIAWTKAVRFDLNGRGMAITVGSIVAGKNGQIYVAGSISSKDSSGLAKFDANGNILWAREIAGTTPVSVALDNNDRLYVSRYHDRGYLASVFTEPLVVEPLAVAVKGKAYSSTLSVKGGTAPYTVSLAAGTLPPGLALDPVTLAISGTPTASGNFYFTLQLRDATGAQNSAEALIRVHEPLEITYPDRGTGRVDFSNGASCSGTCSLSFEPGTVVTMSATAGWDSVFTGWGGACTGTGSCTVTMDGTKAVQAGFKKLTATLTLSRPPTVGSGTVQVSPGTSCAGSCSQIYDFGTGVTLTPVPTTGSVFAGWGGACSGVAPCTLSMTADKLVFAKFQPVGPELPLIAPGYWHGAVLRGDGTISTWGDNVDGALGDGTVGYRVAATANPVLTAAVSVDAKYHTLALKDDGTVWSWGKNNAGQLGDGTTINQPAPRQVSGLRGVTGISAGNSHSLAVKGDGTVWGWGGNAFGALGDGTATLRQTPVQALGITGVVAASAGSGFTLALKGDGTVWGWGENMYAQLGDNTLTNRLTPVQTSSLSGVITVSAGESHGVALKNDGTVWTWGTGSLGRLGTGSTTNSKVPAKVTALSGIVAIATGDAHTLALKSDGTVWAWGYNPSGELGDGTTTQRNTPVQVAGLTGVVRIAAKGSHSYAVKSDGTVWGWGDNTRGSLGDGSTDMRLSPRPISITAATLNSDFTGSASSGVAPLNVNFSDLSTGAPTSWLWNFGDGATSTDKNPAHTYSTPGSYNVSLTATNQTGSSTKTKAGYISVLTCSNPPVRVLSSPTVLFADPFAALLQAVDDDVVQLQGVSFGDLIFDRDIRVRLHGGYDCSYNSAVGTAVLTGKLKVSKGTLRLDGVRLK